MIKRTKINILNAYFSIERKMYSAFQAIDNDTNMNLCKWTMDGSIIYPLIKNNISPYQKCSEKVKDTVAKSILEEFSKELSSLYKIENDIQCKEFIERTWIHGDIFYVATINSQFIGTAAIDCKNNIPVLSHLYVSPEYRKQGWATKLIQHIEEFSKKLGYNIIYLQCKPELIPFYEKRGWDRDIKDIKYETSESSFLMKKDLR